METTEMNWITVIQLLTVAISLATLIVTSVISIHIAKGQNIANIIATQRIRFLEQYRLLTSELLTLCSPELLDGSDVNRKEIILTAHKLKSIFRTNYQEEGEIVDSVNKLLRTYFALIKNQNNQKLKDELDSNIDRLIRLIEIYDLAYWRFIIAQSTNTRVKTDDFEEHYNLAKRWYDEGATLHKTESCPEAV